MLVRRLRQAVRPGPRRRGRRRTERGDDGGLHRGAGAPRRHRRVRHRRPGWGAPRRRGELRRFRRPRRARPHADPGGLCRGEVDPGRAGHARVPGDAVRARPRVSHERLSRLLPVRLGFNRALAGGQPRGGRGSTAGQGRAGHRSRRRGAGQSAAPRSSARPGAARPDPGRRSGPARGRARWSARTSPRGCWSTSTRPPTGRACGSTSSWCWRTPRSPAQVAVALSAGTVGDR